MAYGKYVLTDKATIESSSIVVYIKNPQEMEPEDYPVTTLSRLADASMVGDLVGWKRKFNFTYKGITEVDKQQIIQAVKQMPQFFFYLHSPLPGGGREAIRVYPGAFKFPLMRGGANAANWIWESLSFSLIEK